MDSFIEELMELCYLYLKLGENTKESSIIEPNTMSKYIDPILDALIAREEVLNSIKSKLQYLHRL